MGYLPDEELSGVASRTGGQTEAVTSVCLAVSPLKAACLDSKTVNLKSSAGSAAERSSALQEGGSTQPGSLLSSPTGFSFSLSLLSGFI